MSYESEYEFYKVKLADRQKEDDTFAAKYGLPRIDVAHATVMQRAKERNRLTSEQAIAAVRWQMKVRQYAKAIGVSA